MVTKYIVSLKHPQQLAQQLVLKQQDLVPKKKKKKLLKNSSKNSDEIFTLQQWKKNGKNKNFRKHKFAMHYIVFLKLNHYKKKT